MLGKLIRVTRASIGVPKGTLGLVTRKDLGANAGVTTTPWFVYKVLLCLPSEHRERRYLERDLEEVEV